MGIAVHCSYFVVGICFTLYDTMTRFVLRFFRFNSKFVGSRKTKPPDVPCDTILDLILTNNILIDFSGVLAK